ncbi:hypothetical protein [Helicobacter pylori]|uniref:hypothetical protein n=1 Tax=Helicobacter pylori TaxID=210 RepID=UPI00165B04E4|nr:hypothetical protein [Helicobacter pylori]
MQFIALKTTISMPSIILKDNQKRCKKYKGAKYRRAIQKGNTEGQYRRAIQKGNTKGRW